MLPTELLSLILSFLDPRDFSKVSCLSKAFNDASNEDKHWKKICKRIWQSKASMPFSYKNAKECYFRDIVLDIEKIKKLSIKELKLIIFSHDVAVESLGYFEKREYVEKDISLLPKSVLGETRNFKSLWKCSYYFSLLDSKRTKIKKTELMRYRWTLYIKDTRDVDYFIGVSDNPRFHSEQGNLTFLESGLVELKSLGGDSLANFEYHVIERNGKFCVTVGPYPPLKVFRHKGNWSWVLENAHVFVKSYHYGIE